MSHPLVELARQAIEAELIEGRPFEPPADMRARFPGPAPVFVTLRTADGELRGCIGTITATQKTLADEVAAESLAAATRDPRFPPVGPEEVAELQIEVSVLSTPEAVESLAELDPVQYGVIVVRQRDGRRGLLLPGIPSITTAAEQVTLARRKAWIGDDEPTALYRFRTDKYS